MKVHSKCGRGFYPFLRVTAAAIICAVSALGFGAEKTVIEFWHYFGGDHVKLIKEFIAEFQQQNPDIVVKEVFQGRPNELSQKLQSSFATTPANNPVLATVYENWTSDYVAKGLMDPVQKYIEGPDGFTKEEQEDFVKGFREANTWNGVWTTMPFNKSIYLLYANMDRLKKAGFTTAPRTMNELRDAIIKCTESDGKRVKTYGIGVQPQSEAFTTLYFASGGDLLNEAGEPAFNNELGVSVLKFWQDLQYPDKHLYVDSNYMDAPFGNEQIAMFIYSSASFPYVKRSVSNRFEWIVAPVPGMEGKEPRYVMQGTNLGIFVNRPEAERKAAWKFMKFLVQRENCVRWAIRTGYMPIRYSMLDDPKMKEFMASEPRYAVAASLVVQNKGKQEPSIAVWEGVRQDIGRMVDDVLNRKADPAKVLAETAKRAADRIARAKEQASRSAK
jgi:multiple sugar transport system substrate-binding protein